ncbi:hypothetical protein SISSUDRAFT_1085652 [Sistotremastrum suecicum HHB10207 ss-3]|uniref:Uncharacterized protein n=1 Tax=Sistotremastrum suecicum HHB10207 ss-3 TaxID=1314776 RepID=A0A166IV73_9AGAM|nr:hypothetical protein SISSUDRAFT_1085652 [Sistotremastrum suecicum HHB10207 ss-3]
MPEATDYVPSVRLCPTTQDTSSEYFGRLSTQIPTRNLTNLIESDLLRSIRSVIQKSSSPISSQLLDSQSNAEVKLSWSRDAILLTVGGVLSQSWSFREEGQEIQTVCWGWLQSNHRCPSVVERTNVDVPTAEQRGHSRKLLCLFVFFRSVAKLHLEDGTQYTIHLPFLTRSAWPLRPHGVMIQRVVSNLEHRGEQQRHAILPTLFTLTDPSSELKVVSEELPSPHPSTLPSEPPTPAPLNVVEWVADCHSPARLLITTNAITHKITVWTYTLSVSKEDASDTSAIAGGTLSSDNIRRPLISHSITESLPTSRTDASCSPEPDSLTDRMALGTQTVPPKELGASEPRMHSAFSMRRLLDEELPLLDRSSSSNITAVLFNTTEEGRTVKTCLAILCSSHALAIYNVISNSNDFSISLHERSSALSIAPIFSTRNDVADLLVVSPDHSLCLMTRGCERLQLKTTLSKNIENPTPSAGSPVKFVLIRDPTFTAVTVVTGDHQSYRAVLDFRNRDRLTRQCFLTLERVLSSRDFHRLFRTYLCFRANYPRFSEEFEAFKASFVATFRPRDDGEQTSGDSRDYWGQLMSQANTANLHPERTLRYLEFPVKKIRAPRSRVAFDDKILRAITSLHVLAEGAKLSLRFRSDSFKLGAFIHSLASPQTPLWADYWGRRLANFPHAVVPTESRDFDNTTPWLSVPEVNSSLFSQLAGNAESSTRHDSLSTFLSPHSDIPLPHRMRRLFSVYESFGEAGNKEVRQRSEKTVERLVENDFTLEEVDDLPVGIASPIREAMRTCQMNPPGHWPLPAYHLLDRPDLARMSSNGNESMNVARKGFPTRRRLVSELLRGTQFPTSGVASAPSPRSPDDFTAIRFGTDRRLEEASRMLQSSTMPCIKMDEKHMNDHDWTKEQQLYAIRVAERTMALPIGRAIFEFASLSTVNRDSYEVPRLELTVRIQPHNIAVVPEHGKISQESLNWAEFHNGVAAGMKISPSAMKLASSWIAFNKPAELTPEHAGFLFGLGLTGHLKSMLTWHTFTYLTPKHDLTSMGILLGLAAANLGNADRHVTKLLTVHTPALLPKTSVELNIPLLTQASGLIGVGLLYMGTGNRRMAHVTLNEISRKDLAEPSMNNEHREAYALCAGLAFGMTMVGLGASTSGNADLDLIGRLQSLSQGHENVSRPMDPAFDANISSPAATVALTLMFLRTGRRDIADSLLIPHTALGIDRVPPSLLLLRSFGRSVIMWDEIKPTAPWVISQLPESIASAIDRRAEAKSGGDSLELAYCYIVSGCCFAMGLRYAGTAQEDAYATLIHFFDVFSRLTSSNAGTFEHKVKRAAVREALNVISVSLAMVMSGTGEINSLRRFRFSHGHIGPGSKYGSHVATHMAIGFLFLGGGRYTLGQSNSAIACLIAACYPRFPALSSDNKTHLQALRHLWVLAVQPRCLVARDVDSGDVVYLPVKIKVKEGSIMRSSQLISPTLLPDINRLAFIKVDTPRYWPFVLDLAKSSRHSLSIQRNQTLWVKRRTGFLGYGEDPKGNRSIFARAGAASGDASVLECPRLIRKNSNVAQEFRQFISSYSNDDFHLAFADRFCRLDGKEAADDCFQAYAHTVLLECLTLDKPQMVQPHMELHESRVAQNASTYPLQIESLMFATEFYMALYDKRFSGKTDNLERPPLIRQSLLLACSRQVDADLREPILGPQLIRGTHNPLPGSADESGHPHLMHYLLWNSVPNLELIRHVWRRYQLGEDSVSTTTESKRDIPFILYDALSQFSANAVRKWTAASYRDVTGVDLTRSRIMP